MAAMKREAVGRDPHLAGTFSLEQLARRWKTSRKEIRRLLGRQELAFVEIRGSIRVPRAEVQRYENRHRRAV